MFWMKKKNSGGPAPIKSSLARMIGDEWGKIQKTGDHWAEYLAVKRPRSNSADEFDVRIFDKWCVAQKKVQVQDYSSLDSHPDLILLEGWYNEKSKKGEIRARKTT